MSRACGTSSVRVELSISGLSEEDGIRARAIFQEARAQALMRFHRGDLPAIPLTADSIDRFLFWKEPIGGVTPLTISRMRTRLLSFAEFFGGRPVSLITADDMSAWYHSLSSRSGNARRYNRERPGLSPETVKKYLSDLRQFCAWARDVVNAAPVDLPCERFRIRSSGRISGNRYPPKALTYQELRHIVVSLNKRHPHVGAVIRGMFLLGARPVQLFRLRWSDFRVPTKVNHGKLDLAACKGAPERSLLIGRDTEKNRLFLDCARLFEKYRGRKHRRDDFIFIPAHRRSSGGWTSSVFAHRLHQVCATLGIRDFVAYVTRHTLGTILQQNTRNLATVQATLGHLNVHTQEAYSWRTSADAVEGLQAAEDLMRGLGLSGLPGGGQSDGGCVIAQLPAGFTLT